MYGPYGYHPRKVPTTRPAATLEGISGEVTGRKMASMVDVATPLPVWNRGMTIPTEDYRFCEYRDRRWFCVECSVEQRLACGMGRSSKADMREACAV